MRIRWPELVIGIGLSLAVSGVARDRVEVSARLDDSSRTITGSLAAVISNLSPEMTSLHFRLYPNRFCDSSAVGDGPCGIVIDSLFVNGSEVSREAIISGTDLAISFTYERLTDNELSVRSFFTLHVPPDTSRFGYRDGMYSLEAWLPVAAPRDDTGWLVVDYSNPTVEPVGDPCDFDVTFTVPSKLALIAPGLVDSLVTDSIRTYHIALRDAAHVPIVIAGGMLTDSRTLDGVRQSVYFSEKNKYAVDSIQAWMRYTVDYMSGHVYPYPKDELLLVVGALASGGGGLEHPQMIWLADMAPTSPLYSPRMVVVHEVIHQWFFCLVNSNQAADPWLDEAVTEYFTMRVLQAMTGERGGIIDYYGMAASYLMQGRVFSDRVFPYGRIDRAAGEIDDRDLFPLVYAKGCDLMATLTAQMGSREDEFWQSYVAENLYRRPSPESFYALAEQYCRGDQPGRVKALLTMLDRPDYKVDNITSNSRELSADSTGNEGQWYDNTYEIAVRSAIPFPVELQLVFNDGSVLDTVIDVRTGIHRLARVDARPLVGVIIDPGLINRVDDDFLNNSRFVHRVNASDQRLLSILTFLVESLYSLGWGL